jgi:hypothetical protein
MEQIIRMAERMEEKIFLFPKEKKNNSANT